ILALALVGVGAAWRARSSLIDNRALRFYPYWPEGGYLDGWLHLESASGSGSRVAYAGTNLAYYLFGLGLRNELRYVNVNDHADFRMHDYHALYAGRGESLATSSTPDWDRRDADEAAWLRNLRDQRIQLLFIGLTNRAGGEHNFYDAENFPIERTW